MVRLIFVAILMIFSTATLAAPLDLCLKITGTRAEARTALITLGLNKWMLRRNDAGDLTITGYNHHVAIEFWRRPLLAFGVYDAEGNEITAPVFSAQPYLRIRFLSAAVKVKAKEKIVNAGGLPAGLERVFCPTTRRWF